MKAFFLTIFFCLVIAMGSQAQTYTLTFQNRAYQDLQNDTILSDSGWVGKQYPIRLPFPIRASNVSASQIYVDTDGRIQRLAGGFLRTMIYAFGNCGLQQKLNDTSQISWVVEGVSPTRIAKVQFKNAGFVGDETHTDKVNFQVWMYEDGKQIEICFGPVSANVMRALNGAYGPFLGIGAQYIRGTPAVPVLGTQDWGLNGMPQEGFVYRLTRP